MIDDIIQVGEKANIYHVFSLKYKMEKVQRSALERSTRIGL